MARSWLSGWSEVIKKMPLANDPAPTAPGADGRVSDAQMRAFEQMANPNVSPIEMAALAADPAPAPKNERLQKREGGR